MGKELPRLCPTCAFFRFDGGERGYSTYTPGTDMSIGCDKDHWMLGTGDTLADARKAMLTATTCKDFALYEEPK